MLGYGFLKTAFYFKNMKNIKNIFDFICCKIREYKNIL